MSGDGDHQRHGGGSPQALEEELWLFLYGHHVPRTCFLSYTDAFHSVGWGCGQPFLKDIDIRLHRTSDAGIPQGRGNRRFPQENMKVCTLIGRSAPYGKACRRPSVVNRDQFHVIEPLAPYKYSVIALHRPDLPIVQQGQLMKR